MARARSQPIWAADVADCVVAALSREGGPHDVHEIAGPEAMTYREMVDLALRAKGRARPLLPLPSRLIQRGLNSYEAMTGPIAFTTRDEADLLAATMLSESGTAGALALGVTPRRISEVLGA
jgi:NADH dehydrogenase